MKRTSILPATAIVIRTYEEMRKYIAAFARGSLGLLILLGRAGIGKSHMARTAVGDHCAWIAGNASAFGLYCFVYAHRNRMLVLDDVDGLARDRRAIRLLKALCQTDTIKIISWLADQRGLTSRQVPAEFTTSGGVLVIGNSFASLDPDVAALIDRGHVVEFNPSALEVHREVARWFGDQQIHDFVGSYLPYLANHSLRTYLLAAELKESGLNWREFVLNQGLQGSELAVASLQLDPRYPTEQQREQAFASGGHGGRSTYYNIKNKLGKIHAAESIPVLGAAPNKAPAWDYRSLDIGVQFAEMMRVPPL